MKKLSTACYIIRNAITYMPATSVKVIYYPFFYSAMTYGIIFWGNCWHSSTNYKKKKRKLELWKDVGIDFHVQIYLKNYTFYL
jgi:hypothetical protein